MVSAKCVQVEDLPRLSNAPLNCLNSFEGAVSMGDSHPSRARE